MKRKIQYLKVKFFLGFISVLIGFAGATVALFQWVESTGVHYLFGQYARYVLGFGGFAAMIFGALLVNDAWVLREVSKGRYEVSSSQMISASSTVGEEGESPDKIYAEAEVSPQEGNSKHRIVRKIMRSYELREGFGGKIIRFFKRILGRETSEERKD